MDKAAGSELSSFVEALRTEINPTGVNKKAVRSFLKAIEREDLESADLRQVIYRWVNMMTVNGRSKEVRRRYVYGLSSEYHRWRGRKMAGTAEIQKYIGDYNEDLPQLLALIRRMAAGLDQRTPDEKLSASLVLTALMTGRLSIAEVLTLRKDEVPGMTPQAREICSLWSAPNRPTVFPLLDHDSSPGDCFENIREQFVRNLRSMGWPEEIEPSDDILAQLWIEAAQRVGLSNSTTVSFLNSVPAAYRYLEETARRQLSEAERNLAITKISDFLMPDYKRWYVMKIRRSYSVENAVRSMRDDGYFVETYYPQYEIKRKVGNKLKNDLVPYISKTLFFKIKSSQVPALSQSISQYAWIYCTLDGGLKRPMIVKDISRFQKYIGALTADIELSLGTAEEYRRGEQVRITGGNFEGYTGVIQRLPDDSQELMITIVDSVIKAKVHIPACHIERIERNTTA